jgi:archaellum component FlaC
MTKTRVDEMLIEMITPRVREIEERFGRGEGLSQDDINTLLLKSQYNHINHLDAKLDQVAASVVALEGKFATFKAEMSAEFERRIGALETKFSQLETKFEKAQADMRDTIITTMRWYIGGAGIVIVLLMALDLFVQ